MARVTARFGVAASLTTLCVTGYVHAWFRSPTYFDGGESRRGYVYGG